MKTNKILNTLLGSIAIITLTACGSGSGGDSGSCGNMPSTKDSDRMDFMIYLILTLTKFLKMENTLA